ncbi:MAG: winged helix DNA-binding protein [Gemmatimonadaceae bacterium]|nr:winged helix DNA-binding protein [Gemmatimonadaceae bacterium]
MTQRRTSIQEELQQRRPFQSKRQEVFLALLRTAAVVKRPVAKVVEAHDLSLAQYNVLRILRGAGDEGLPTLTIRERMIEEAAGITRLIDKLEASGLVRRERGASSDRRQVFCRITEAGLKVLVELDPSVAAATDETLVDVDTARLDDLLLVLEEVRASARQAQRDAEGG